MPIDDGQLVRSALAQGVYEGLAGFRLAMRRFLAFSEKVLADAEVTSQQYQAMLVIKTAKGGRVMIRELAEQMLIQHHGAVQLADRLSAAGLAERIPSEDDRRSVLIGLTATGEAVLEALARIHLQAINANEPLLADSLSMLRHLAALA
ncbi:MarR family transcriptional regulator [Rhizobium sp. BK251]|uniref:MarR family winged helix-turn-helix transcriptional regulator n=1 Tax=Rhizobium sp. BK251 TaxID=2512125 RepID=UPI00104D5DCC|nr:MarR family transcriptional regulator [Rhizobium sp. BK251]TCL63663.1 DNA-binding MarR family transcriptional regulator [Rhizobium sp. BK251]